MPNLGPFEGRSTIRVDVIMWDGADARVDRLDCWTSTGDRQWSTCTLEVSGATGLPEPDGMLAIGLVFLAAISRRRRGRDESSA